jgi:hypothetical protein
LLRGTRDLRFSQAWEMASATHFQPLQANSHRMRRQA